MTERKINFDFGDGFSFRAYLPSNGHERETILKGKETTRPAILHCDRIFIHETSQYGTVLVLSKSIPTFDSGDREYDSWHSLYLWKGPHNTIDGLYCCGGYVLASATRCIKLIRCPEPVDALLKDLGIK